MNQKNINEIKKITLPIILNIFSNLLPISILLIILSSILNFSSILNYLFPITILSSIILYLIYLLSLKEINLNEVINFFKFKYLIALIIIISCILCNLSLSIFNYTNDFIEENELRGILILILFTCFIFNGLILYLCIESYNNIIEKISKKIGVKYG